MNLRRISGALLAVVTLVVATAGGVLAGAAPAAAAACGSADGVTVVVDPHQLGGGLQSVCDSDGGGTKATTLFTNNGFALTYVQRQPGFVCRINGAPASDPCVNTPPADAYWGLFWSDGKSGKWSYSSTGAASLKVPDGGYVAFSWQSGKGRALPGLTPKAHGSSTPTQSSSPSHPGGNGDGSHAASPSSTSSTAAPSASDSASNSGSASPTKKATKKPRKSHSQIAVAESPTASTSASPTSTEVEPTSAEATDDGGLPGWVVPVVLVLLLGAAGGVMAARHTRGEHQR